MSVSAASGALINDAALSYYDRIGDASSEGIVFANAFDLANENRIAGELAEAWHCDIVRYGGPRDPIDFYAIRKGHIVAWLEVKHRNHPVDDYPTVFLNFRKYLHLRTAEQATNLPAVFAVGFPDALLWIGVSDVDASDLRLAGCSKRVKSNTDIEPIIYVQTAHMKWLP